MSEQNHYQVLGVERTADERAIKKAYFTLVRQYPPDTHPEDFKRIREAYEVLSDPVARKRFDAADHSFSEYDEEVSVALREAEAAVKGGDEEAAQAKLEALLEAHPELLVARENLAFSYTRANKHDLALQHFTALAERAPETARFHFFRGIALRRLDRADEAQACIAKAHEIDPKDLRFHVGLVDVLAQRKQFDEARAVLDEAIATRDPESEDGVGLTLRKIDLLFVSGAARAAQQEVAAFLKVVRGAKDPELPKYAATQLAGLAGALFFRKEIEQANALLGFCRELHPDSPVHRPYPLSATIDVAALPDEGRAWLARQTPGPTSPTFAQAIWVAPMAALLAAVLITVVALSLLASSAKPWDGGDYLLAALAVAAAVGSLSYAFRDIVRIVTSPLRAFTTLHPLYLVQANADRLTVYPLFNLSNVSAAHHHTNGVYSHTLITLWFGREQTTLRLVGQDYAQGWLNYLLECRGRSLELLMEGYLEAEQGVDLLPPAALDTGAARKARVRAEGRRWYLGAAAVGLGLWVAAIPWHARRVDEARWRAAVKEDQVASYAGYLRAAPDGHHADDARRELDRRFEAAAAALRAATSPRAKDPAVLADLLAALRRQGATRVPVMVQLDASAGRGTLLASWSQAAMGTRADSLISRLNEVLARAGVDGAVRLERAMEASGPAAIRILCSPEPDGSVLTDGVAMSLPSFRIRWTVQITIDGAPRFEAPFTTEMPSELRVARLESDATIYERTSGRMVEAFAWQLAEALGLGGTAATIRRAAGPLSASAREQSPYVR